MYNKLDDNPIKNKLKRGRIHVKYHLQRNKSGYIMGVAFVGAVVLVVRNNRGMREFLIEKGINPLEFFNPEALVD